MINENYFDYLAIIKNANGFTVVDTSVKTKEREPSVAFVFKDTKELCEWITEYYQEKP